MNYTIRKTPLARRGRANVQVTAHTRDELKRLAQEHGKTILDMVEVLLLAWNANARRVMKMIDDPQPTIDPKLQAHVMRAWKKNVQGEGYKVEAKGV
jgi:hypothetical protein